MNRIILIGNGFDLAHGLPTSYGNFIDWYWSEWKKYFFEYKYPPMDDILCSIDNKSNRDTFSIIVNAFGYEIYNLHGYDFGKKLLSYDFDINRLVVKPCALFKEIHKSVETKGWVDIENEYYNLLSGKNSSFGCTVKELNEQLAFLQKKLVEYLSHFTIDNIKKKELIEQIIYSPIKYNDISISGTNKLIDHYKKWMKCSDREWMFKFGVYKIKSDKLRYVNEFRKDYIETDDWTTNFEMLHKCPDTILLPDNIMFLNFNYTNTAKLYLPTPKPGFVINHIHGELTNPKSVIFGYGDEFDENYKKLSNLNDNEYLKNFKSIKYLESDRYRKALQFMEAEPYQVYIMGHSCGNSDRTFLNTLFEHKNCVSIKPYYYKDGEKDNYLDIVQNISRNFTDMKLMRDRVVNKTYCEHFSIKEPKTND